LTSKKLDRGWESLNRLSIGSRSGLPWRTPRFEFRDRENEKFTVSESVLAGKVPARRRI
jgi:hypothetical protein